MFNKAVTITLYSDVVVITRDATVKMQDRIVNKERNEATLIELSEYLKYNRFTCNIHPDCVRFTLGSQGNTNQVQVFPEPYQTIEA